ncbi:MAG TPA: hypothetical protein VG123_19050 [Streptosporangiaceae bacterium]|jgi:hypothetical protein|nr:hypothetical protein [Streptosporangiaceae bacterium]
MGTACLDGRTGRALGTGQEAAMTVTTAVPDPTGQALAGRLLSGEGESR